MTLESLIGSVEEFRKLDSEMQLQTVLVFLLAARNPGCTLRDLEKLTGLRSSSVSRNIAALSERHRTGSKGHQLLVTHVDLIDRRHRRVYLTPKGQRVLNSLVEVRG